MSSSNGCSNRLSSLVHKSVGLSPPLAHEKKWPRNDRRKYERRRRLYHKLMGKSIGGYKSLVFFQRQPTLEIFTTFFVFHFAFLRLLLCLIAFDFPWIALRNRERRRWWARKLVAKGRHVQLAPTCHRHIVSSLSPPFLIFWYEENTKKIVDWPNCKQNLFYGTTRHIG